MIRIFLLNVILTILYLWGLENNRYICLSLWIIGPILNLLVYSLIEKNKR